MTLYLKALEIATASNNFGGMVTILLKVIEMSLLIATQLKYNAKNGMNDETRTLYQQMLDSVSKQVLFDQKVKSVMDQFLALTMQRVYEGQERLHQMASDRQGSVIEF